MEAMQPRICIQPQSRRSPRYYITMIIRAPSRVFQFQDSQHSFKTAWTTYYQGCTENASQHPIVGNITAPSAAVAFPYLFSCISSSFLSCLKNLYFLANSHLLWWPDRAPCHDAFVCRSLHLSFLFHFVLRGTALHSLLQQEGQTM